MSWDEKAEDYARGVWPPDGAAVPDIARLAIQDGARWQRGALLADDVIERAARVLCAAAGENPDSNELWDEEPPWLDYTDEARAALSAALGIEGEEA